MAELKRRQLWKPNAGLAQRKGKWITGGGNMRGSEHYPADFGRAICVQLENPMNMGMTVAAMMDPVVTKLQVQRDHELSDM